MEFAPEENRNSRQKWVNAQNEGNYWGSHRTISPLTVTFDLEMRDPHQNREDPEEVERICINAKRDERSDRTWGSLLVGGRKGRGQGSTGQWHRFHMSRIGREGYMASRPNGRVEKHRKLTMEGVSPRGRAERRQNKIGSDWIYGERAQPSEQNLKERQWTCQVTGMEKRQTVLCTWHNSGSLQVELSESCLFRILMSFQSAPPKISSKTKKKQRDVCVLLMTQST
ncbi:hypothetical protein DFH08DRAFT_807350 [Mycena albidolilacea]|uniref:Uncharacterized protein n=1 Tax=Mycena albidolilacea TaxID=1033008 RepID=A0AAD7A6N8_9AGAR|nr:hypothetical protein DFH08DRAFT_807350 [Mycena albidolilacea]